MQGPLRESATQAMVKSGNILYFGDNKDVLPKVPDESVDLVYIDPPFNSARQYNLLFKQIKGDPSPAQIMAFEDTWRWSANLMEDFVLQCEHPRLRRLVDSLYDVLGESEMMAYVLMMAPRVEALRRKLKATGSMYLHCDPAGSHYLKLVMDCVFEAKNFRNEVIWKRSNPHNDAGRYGRIHDTLLFYTAGESFTWNKVYTAYSQAYLDSEWKRLPSGRFYKAENMLDPQNKMEEYEFEGTLARWRTGPAGMRALWDAPQTEVPGSHGRVKLGRNGKPIKRCRIMFLDEMSGVPLQDVFLDVPNVRGSKGKGEHRGYPTQKPVALLRRLLAASSNEGDTVLDAFCGCGTTIAAAQAMNRKWIGIDITYLAVREIEDRLAQDFMLEKGTDYRVEGLPKDLDAARQFFEATRKDNHKQFEMWAVSLVGGRPRSKKGTDRGIDGDLVLHDRERNQVIAPIQVKGGESAGSSAIRDFAHVISREKAPTGGFLCLREPTAEMKKEAATLGMMDVEGRRVPRMQILPIGDVLEKGSTFRTPDGFTRPPSRYRMQGTLGF